MAREVVAFASVPHPQLGPGPASLSTRGGAPLQASMSWDSPWGLWAPDSMPQTSLLRAGGVYSVCGPVLGPGKGTWVTAGGEVTALPVGECGLAER